MTVYNSALKGIAETVSPCFLASSLDTAALYAYYKAEARSNDTKRVFSLIMRDLVTHYGYNIDVSNALALWYYMTVLLPERPKTIDVYGMLLCYLNTGEIDDEHEW